MIKFASSCFVVYLFVLPAPKNPSPSSNYSLPFNQWLNVMLYLPKRLLIWESAFFPDLHSALCSFIPHPSIFPFSCHFTKISLFVQAFPRCGGIGRSAFCFVSSCVISP
jgi:hypothetical protein